MSDNTPAREEPAAALASKPGAVPVARRLSTKLLLLTVSFVLIAELLIFPPSVANFRQQWLEQRLATAAAVSVVLLQADPEKIPQNVQDDVLKATGVKAIAVRERGVSRLMVVSGMPPKVDQHVDLDGAGAWMAIMQTGETLFFGGHRIIRAFGKVGDSDKEFELILSDHRLRTAMLKYARNIALLSLLVSAITASLVFAAIHGLMIRPIRNLRNAMLTFAAVPDSPDSIVRVTARKDELGVTERELAGMQTQLQRILGEQKHLADLGLAVSKINHDMRNILASAQLISDRLRLVKDPTVQIFAPKLLRALDRAVAYSEGVLAYGRTQEPAPVRRRLRLRQLVEEVQGMLGLDASDRHRIREPGRCRLRGRRRFRAAVPRAHQSMPQRRAGNVRGQRERAGAPPHHFRRAHGRGLLDLRHRHRTRPAAEGARESVLGFPGRGAQRRHRPWPGHRQRAGARPWRHHPAGRERQRPHGVFDHHPRPPGQARRSAAGPAPPG